MQRHPLIPRGRGLEGGNMEQLGEERRPAREEARVEWPQFLTHTAHTWCEVTRHAGKGDETTTIMS